MDEKSWLWIGTAGMGLGCAVLALLRGSRTRGEEQHYFVHLLVPMIALASYFAMATGQGAVTLASGRTFLYARFVDWAFTTPLLLYGLAAMAFGPRHKRVGLIAGLIALDVYMIATGFFAGWTELGLPMKWVWYGLSCIAFLGVYWLLWDNLAGEARVTAGEHEAIFRRNTAILSVLWFLYPVVFLFGPEGLQSMSPTTSTALYTILDLLAKIGYGLVAAVSLKNATTRALQRNQVPEHEILGPDHPHYPVPDLSSPVAPKRR